jgi:hypothetical protein
MNTEDVRSGRIYVLKRSGRVKFVKVDGRNPAGGWDTTEITTGRRILVQSARHLRREVYSANHDGAHASAAGYDIQQWYGP